MSTANSTPTSASNLASLTHQLLAELEEEVHLFSEAVDRRYGQLLEAKSRSAPGASGQEIRAALEFPRSSASPSGENDRVQL